MFENNFGKSLIKSLHHAQDLIIRRGSAMGPLVPLLSMVPIILIAAYFFGEYVQLVLILTMIAIIVFYCVTYRNFAKSDPDRLQSEEYRYGMKRMQLIAAKELPHPMPVDELNLTEATSNPTLPDLEKVNLNQHNEVEEYKK